MATSRSSRFAARLKPKVPCILIPPTPTHPLQAMLSEPLTNTWTPISPILIPPRIMPPSMQWPETNINFPLATVSNIVSDDLVKIAELFATMKRTLGVLNTTFDILGKQTEKLASLAPVIKSVEQIRDTRTELQNQIRKQEASTQAVSVLLENAVKDSVIDRLKEQIFTEIQVTIANEVKGRVQRELAARIPAHLRQQVQDHPKTKHEVQSTFNTMPRHKANSPLTEPLRPLLRPLPTPEQSPTYVVNRTPPPTTSLDPSPLSAFPRLRVPAPTPTVTSSYYLPIPSGGNQSIQLIPPTPSLMFPRDIKSLFALGPDATRRLITEYNLDGSDECSPITSDPRPKAAPIVSTSSYPSEYLSTSDKDDHAQSIDRSAVLYVKTRTSAPISQVTERPKLHLVIPNPLLASVAEDQ